MSHTYKDSDQGELRWGARTQAEERDRQETMDAIARDWEADKVYWEAIFSRRDAGDEQC